MFWQNITEFLSFTGVTDVTVWQDVAISSVLIPIVLLSINWLIEQWNNFQPAKLLLRKFLDKNTSILVFHSQMSGADDQWNFNPNQKYITKYPDPLPTDSQNMSIQRKFRIDPILSQAEADCLTDVYNILGKYGKVTNIIRADLISDWGKWSNPIITIGFNPKTMKLIEKCEPVYFELMQSAAGMTINDIDHKITYDSYIPNDAGIIQKTFIKGSNNPIYIFAGIGTAGTGASGYILLKNITELGKLYGNSPFCAFLKVKINEGRESAYIDKLCPKPKWHRIILYPFIYYQFYKNKKFL